MSNLEFLAVVMRLLKTEYPDRTAPSGTERDGVARQAVEVDGQVFWLTAQRGFQPQREQLAAATCSGCGDSGELLNGLCADCSKNAARRAADEQPDEDEACDEQTHGVFR